MGAIIHLYAEEAEEFGLELDANELWKIWAYICILTTSSCDHPPVGQVQGRDQDQPLHDSHGQQHGIGSEATVVIGEARWCLQGGGKNSQPRFCHLKRRTGPVRGLQLSVSPIPETCARQH